MSLKILIDANNFNEAFIYSMEFYKEKATNASFKLSYVQRIKLLALMRQATQGPCKDHNDIGLLDIIGNDRLNAWKMLGTMSSGDAKFEFMNILDSISPDYIVFLQNKLTNTKYDLNVEKENISNENNKPHSIDKNDIMLDNSHNTLNSRCRENKDSLFLDNFSKNLHISEVNSLSDLISDYNTILPKDRILEDINSFHEISVNNKQDDDLIHDDKSCDNKTNEDILQHGLNEALKSQLKNTYLFQINQLNKKPFSDIFEDEILNKKSDDKMMKYSKDCILNKSSIDEINELLAYDEDNYNTIDSGLRRRKYVCDSGSIKYSDSKIFENKDNILDLPLAEAKVWTRKDIAEFKQLMMDDLESLILVSPGEIVTIRIPTRTDGTNLIWEFATDDFDISFSIAFEFKPGSSEDGESDDEEEDEDGDEEIYDPNKGYIVLDTEAPKESEELDDKVLKEEVLPLARYNSHIEVQCGSHSYESRGVYLLMFNNSYSMLRSKNVYYRVFYTQ